MSFRDLNLLDAVRLFKALKDEGITERGSDIRQSIEDFMNTVSVSDAPQGEPEFLRFSNPPAPERVPVSGPASDETLEAARLVGKAVWGALERSFGRAYVDDLRERLLR